MTSEKGSRKDKNQNIQVFVRLRPLNQRERDIKSLGVIEIQNRDVIARLSHQNHHTKSFTFDRVFGPNAKQVEVYQDVVSPLIEEVLAGYNCTVFAYGQTGTGKTHTMVGQSTGDEHTWQNDPLAGIIPRALSQLFDELRLSNTEYTVRVSYLELYNEELFDLLAASEDNSKLRIYEDVTRKGSNIVNGLEEITVSNKNEVYKIMSQGQERKRVASTLMNAQSRNQSKSIFKRNIFFRSHTVFTIVVHMRENSPEGEELVKIGKLNLVDLAGSENISKAGTDNPSKKERARECVNINQSLLTLGRVITALVERHPHIPYRESKLTRILQESLGGRTKTSIIATISPGHKDLEETMSTLEYASRAKNIQNKPEVNQKMTKKAILKEYAEEIDRLKRDLQASRDKNGVYLATDTYTEITLKQEEQRKEIQELLLQKRAVEEQKDKAEAMFSEVNRTLEQRASELTLTQGQLRTVQTELTNTVNMLQTTKLECEEQKHLVKVVSETERALTAQAHDILSVADVATNHVQCLHDTVDKRRNVESKNLEVTRSYREQAAMHRSNMAAGTKHFTMTIAEALMGLHTAIDNFANKNAAAIQADKDKIEDILAQMRETMHEMKKLTDESQDKLVCAADSQRTELQSAVDRNNSAMKVVVQRLLQRVQAGLRAVRASDVSGHVATFVQQWYAGAAARVSALCSAQRTFAALMQQASDVQMQAANEQRAKIIARKEFNDGLALALKERIERSRSEVELRLAEQTEGMEAERAETALRLRVWMENEQNAFEQRLRQHVHAETTAMEERLSRRMESVQQERAALQARVSADLELQERILQCNARGMELMMQELQGWETSQRHSEAAVRGYDKEFDEGARAISADMEVFSADVVEVVHHIHQELLEAMTLANQQTEQEAESVMSEVQSSGAQFVVDTEAALRDLITTTKHVVHDMVQNIQSRSSASASTLADVSSSLTASRAACTAATTSHGDAVGEMTSRLHLFEDNMRNAVSNLEEVEGRCLSEEYTVYSPTGKTPSRVSYVYPRALAATSPHHRLLARYRAHCDDNHDECVVVESDNESRAPSDYESSSEDLSVFLVPSPPAAPAAPAAPTAPTPRHNTQPNMQHNAPQGIVKSTSETNIYRIKKNINKENENRSTNCKKPSKLPAPASLKKPFVDRNGADN